MKKRFLCPSLPKPHAPVLLTEEESHHALKVMRLQDGDLVEAIDGKGHWACAKLRSRGVPPQLEWIEPEANGLFARESQLPGPSNPLILEMAVLKAPAMEWIVEKAVELGIHVFVPVLTDHTVIQIKSKGPEAFRQRWQKIADQSLKQCGRLERMEVSEPIYLTDLITQTSTQTEKMRIWCDETSQKDSPYLLNWLESTQPSSIEVRVLIGPEGGWSQNERRLLSTSKQTTKIHLGSVIFRAETAALFSTSVVSAFLWGRVFFNRS